jgi:hypothetical protein
VSRELGCNYDLCNYYLSITFNFYRDSGRYNDVVDLKVMIWCLKNRKLGKKYGMSRLSNDLMTIVCARIHILDNLQPVFTSMQPKSAFCLLTCLFPLLSDLSSLLLHPKVIWYHMWIKFRNIWKRIPDSHYFLDFRFAKGRWTFMWTAAVESAPISKTLRSQTRRRSLMSTLISIIFFPRLTQSKNDIVEHDVRR